MQRNEGSDLDRNLNPKEQTHQGRCQPAMSRHRAASASAKMQSHHTCLNFDAGITAWMLDGGVLYLW